MTGVDFRIDGEVVAFVEEAWIVAAEVYAQVLDVCFLCYVVRDSVAESNVFQTQISLIDEVLGLRIVVVTAFGDVSHSTCIVDTGIETGVFIVLADVDDTVVRVVDVIGCLTFVYGEVGRAHEREVEGRCCPYVALAHTLEEKVEVEAFVGCSEAEAILIARQSVADHFQVAVIVG